MTYVTLGSLEYNALLVTEAQLLQGPDTCARISIPPRPSTSKATAHKQSADPGV